MHCHYSCSHTRSFSSPQQLLVAHDAPLFIHNVADLTPCDVAWKAKEIVIAKQLESIMVLDVNCSNNIIQYHVL